MNGAPRIDVLAVGELLLDLISGPGADDLGAARSFSAVSGGSVSNFACTCARLGLRTALVACVGADRVGDRLVREVEAAGVDTSLLERTAAAPTSVVLITRTLETPDSLPLRGADTLVRGGGVSDDLLARADLLHTSCFALSASPAREAFLELCGRAAAAGPRLSLELNYAPTLAQPVEEALRGVEALCAAGALVKASADDVRRLFGAGVSAEEGAHRLLGMGATLACVTQGADEVLVARAHGELVRVSPPPLALDPIGADPRARKTAELDATGAGDAFWAGFIAALKRGASTAECAASGIALAARKLRGLGPITELDQVGSPAERPGGRQRRRRERPADARSLLREVSTDAGILASPMDHANYRRVWARDGVICGLAGLIDGDERVATALRATLATLAEARGPHGEIPSNVEVGADGSLLQASYGGRAGRVDAIPWFAIGIAEYARRTGDHAFRRRLAARAERALDLLGAWEFNARGLVYAPAGGTWADEYVQHGYVLYVQLLRRWADELWDRPAPCPSALIEASFWPGGAGTDDDDVAGAYDPGLARTELELRGRSPHWLPAFSPIGYDRRFDAWANALAVLQGVGGAAKRKAALDAGERLRARARHRLVPAFWPPIVEGDAEWPALVASAADGLRNVPLEYHNGGAWPVVNAWWGMALCADGRLEAARAVAEALRAVNEGPVQFPEFVHGASGEPGGVSPCAWSAAGEILLDAALAGRALLPRSSAATTTTPRRPR